MPDMTPKRLLLSALLLGLSGLPLMAQPLVLPGARLPGGEGAPVPPAPIPGGPGAPPAVPAPGVQPAGSGLPAPGPAQAPGQGAAAPAPPRPTAVRMPGEEAVVGRDLKRNGNAGMLRIERAGGGLTARVVLEGTSVARPGQACQVRIADGQPVPLSARGRPAGSLRYALEASACPLAFDILEESVLVREPEAVCTFQEADCQVEVRGLWGPEPARLLPQAKAIESARGAADKAVRENYRAMTARAKPAETRTVAAEQAAFSSERTMACRDYAREGTLGFCHARFTEARAAELAARLGVTTTAADAPKPRPRPRPPAPPAETLPGLQ